MLIGEAPGQEEANTGRPFTGAAGRFLEGLLRDVPFRIDRDLYITNICKCRPPENRKPKPGEISQCTRRYLAKEIAIVKPRILVLLGRTPTDWLFPEGFTRHEIVKVPTRPWHAIATWHPAYYLHRPQDSVLRDLMRSFRLAKEFVNV